MPNEASAKENLDQQLTNNSLRLKELVDQQYNVEITRSIGLFFSSPDHDCATALLRALFAKGMHVDSPQPEEDGDRYRIRVSVKRSLRDAVREEFTHDLVQTAAGMNGRYDGWDILADVAAEETQQHADAPDMQRANPEVLKTAV